MYVYNIHVNIYNIYWYNKSIAAEVVAMMNFLGGSVCVCLKGFHTPGVMNPFLMQTCPVLLLLWESFSPGNLRVFLILSSALTLGSSWLSDPVHLRAAKRINPSEYLEVGSHISSNLFPSLSPWSRLTVCLGLLGIIPVLKLESSVWKPSQTWVNHYV